MDNFQAQLTAAFLVSLLHGLIPSHWLPLIAFAKNQKHNSIWLLRMAGLIATIHALGTILIGYLVYHTAHLSHIGSLSIEDSQSLDDLRFILPFEKFSALILFILGLVFLYRHYNHKHFHLDHKRFGKRILFGIIIAMFLSPCMEIVGFYFTLAPYGFDAFMELSAMYLLTTVVSISLGVMIFNKGMEKLNIHRWEHNAGIFSSVLMMVSATLMWFF
jgi:hypothetical protein